MTICIINNFKFSCVIVVVVVDYSRALCLVFVVVASFAINVFSLESKIFELSGDKMEVHADFFDEKDDVMLSGI